MAASPRRQSLVAVLIGIDAYSHVGYEPLANATADAQRLHTALAERIDRAERERLHLLLAPSGHAMEVSGERILAAIVRALEQAGPEDTLLIYFAGYRWLHEGEVLLLMPHAADTTDAETLPLSRIVAAVGAGRVGRRLLILDGCLLSEARSVSDAEETTLLRALAHDWAVWLASSPQEVPLMRRNAATMRPEGLFVTGLIAALRYAERSYTGIAQLLRVAATTSRAIKRELEQNPADYEPILATQRGRSVGTQGPLLVAPPLSLRHGDQEQSADFQIIPRSSRQQNRERQFTDVASLLHELPRFLREFPRLWWRFTFQPWPIEVPHSIVRLLGGCFYALTIATTALLWHAGPVFATASGAVTLALWWLILAFGVAGNEYRWPGGGWGAPIVIGSTNLILAALLWRWQPAPPSPFIYGDTVALTGLAWLYGFNAFHTLLTFGEFLREDGRGSRQDLVFALIQLRQEGGRNGIDSFLKLLPRTQIWYLRILPVFLGYFGVEWLWCSRNPDPIVARWLPVRAEFALLFIVVQLLWYMSGYRLYQNRVYPR
jgi:hypothetical protein